MSRIDDTETLAALNRVLVCALLALGDAGGIDEACRLAAAGWSVLWCRYPREADHLNGVLHSLQGHRTVSAANDAAPLKSLVRMLVCALLALADAGDIEEACQLAAKGWSVLRREHPREAERFNGVLHSLTRPTQPETIGL